MENPEKDILSVVLQLTTTTSPDVQKEAVERYMTDDVSFEHPVCCVRSAPGSRATVLKIYQWYRILSPTLDLKINSVTFDSTRDILYLDLTQWFKFCFLPLQPAPARLITRLELRKVDGLFYISRQEDFYHTLDFMKLLFPPLAPVIVLWLLGAGVFSYWAAVVSQQLGYWAPKPSLSKPEDETPGDRQELYYD